jgi:hypothetical protein
MVLKSKCMALAAIGHPVKTILLTHPREDDMRRRHTASLPERAGFCNNHSNNSLIHE